MSLGKVVNTKVGQVYTHYLRLAGASAP